MKRRFKLGKNKEARELTKKIDRFSRQRNLKLAEKARQLDRLNNEELQVYIENTQPDADVQAISNATDEGVAQLLRKQMTKVIKLKYETSANAE